MFRKIIKGLGILSSNNLLDKNGALSTYFFDENLYDENIKD